MRLVLRASLFVAFLATAQPTAWIGKQKDTIQADVVNPSFGHVFDDRRFPTDEIYFEARAEAHRPPGSNLEPDDRCGFSIGIKVSGRKTICGLKTLVFQNPSSQDQVTLVVSFYGLPGRPQHGVVEIPISRQPPGGVLQKISKYFRNYEDAHFRFFDKKQFLPIYFPWFSEIIQQGVKETAAPRLSSAIQGATMYSYRAGPVYLSDDTFVELSQALKRMMK